MASDSEEIDYQSLDSTSVQLLPLNPKNKFNEREDEEESEISFQEETGFMVHMSSDVNKSQWNHVDDLDKFFSSVYDYHQRHGFQNMVLAEVLQLLQFVFVVVFMTFLNWCVNYPELFDEIPRNSTHKKTFDDIIYPARTCIARFNFLTWFLLIFCMMIMFGRCVKMAINFITYLRTRSFFISALNIETKDLSNMTWHEVQARLIEVQKEEQICIHKQELSQLDIYHRILRFKNYLVAMVNKNLLPVKLQIPIIGQQAILTHGMRFNLEILLYWSPWSIFVNSYTLRGGFKSHHMRKKLADQLSTHIAILALLNLILSPFIFVYQLVYFFFRYAEFVKKSPSFLGSRQWANYGRLYLRHFNELDHELNARLNRAYVPAKMYMNTFVTPSVIIIAKYLAFFAGAPAAVLFVFGILDFNDVTKVEHLFTVASVCGMIATVCSSMIPDENEVYCPERLMMSVLAQIHYMPDHWKGRAHTSVVRDEFSDLFQYKLTYILEELLSPLFTPFWLMFALRPKTLNIVDFFRCFTIEVSGVGDVCSFAQMDIKKHGNPQWNVVGESTNQINISRTNQAENGKTELSLMHFTTTNPEWKPPEQSHHFLHGVKQGVQKDLPTLTSIATEPYSLSSMGYFSSLDPFMPLVMPNSFSSGNTLNGGQELKLRGGLSAQDCPLNTLSASSTLSPTSSFHNAAMAMPLIEEGQRELLSGNMSLSVLHMHGNRRCQQASSQPARLHSLGQFQENTPTPSSTNYNRVKLDDGAFTDMFTSSVSESSEKPFMFNQESYHYSNAPRHDQTEHISLNPITGSHLYNPEAEDTNLSIHEPESSHLAEPPYDNSVDGALSSLPPLDPPALSFVPNQPSPYNYSPHLQRLEESVGEHELDTSLSQNKS